MVRETGTERTIVHTLAPHLVLPEKMLLPIIKGGTYGKWAASFGVWVYDMVAGVSGKDRRKMLSKKQALKKEPLLNEKVLKGGCLYAEYRTDDARLTIELMKSAARFGAIGLNYCEVKDFVYDNDKVQGVQCQDNLTGNLFEIKAKQVVSAGGPWVDTLRKTDQSLKGKRLHLTKGVHIVFPHEKLPLKHSVYFDVPDGRMVFAIPRGKITYVGTTDTTYKASLNRVVATKADATYLLGAVRHAFPSIKVEEADIISNWAGLRPLIHEDGKSPSELSRKDEIFESKSGLISIAGGKLTGYRKMAQRIVNLVNDRFNLGKSECKTKTISLTFESFKNAQAVQDYIQTLEKRVIQLGLTPYHAWYLTTTYGKQSDTILEEMETYSDAPEITLARAEAWFTVHYEMVNSLEDFFVRRTGRLYFDIGSIGIVRTKVIKDFQNYLEWDELRLQKEVANLDMLLQDATTYYEEEIEETVNEPSRV